ncbi:MAG: tRNA (N6-isopentenyl adenosine(37)-C2)-methylthiotransferase MiaB [Zetaproteobacteria bacterium CG12_big_fil_rev_8_21_14_0_65_54_13]|nr:MAG: tRNA (N6-isopentenyl adenosine(37)-C2)-methylthiotransferase MiaB [Zetaproteobacteria bacterium CG12_big_fil_rev_8_21_14_0_65_54_13]PIX54469.1 MAG: tRNA (N6-isopentenyl adenosine(37)-C2)-methylthiotransferase MiaB [Zetaproteobacteria bacterium CG_4_10_14_3_um_filter_54_28]PJA26960.1 MAG: tRNA (N6-isopentenyl adenosine(37)-C2)-methylthiotransferase MiaB [Zetaproteobacteria bacterium CG_4_9_14_3_um_filter_54_145]
MNEKTKPLQSLDTLFIRTYGCQMNEYDSGRMADIMKQAYGLRLVALPEDADVILMNTCSVREKAEEKVYSELGRYRKLKLKRPDMIIGVGGCVGQQEGERIQKRAPYVDLVFGPQTYHRLPEMVKQIRRERVHLTQIEMPEIEKFDHLPRHQGKGVAGCVTIMEGCDKFCTFCVVPYTRGPELSRPVADILSECQQLLDDGVVEISLLGQNVNGYRGPGVDGEEWDFTMLLYAVAGLDGLKRLRFSTSHPMEMTSELCLAFAELPQLMPYLHLPVQSGSDAMLKAMHRGHDRDTYLRLIAELREHCPDIALSSDFIVGYPGESDSDFEDTLDLVRQVGYDAAYCFKYSPRPGTPAAHAEDNVPEAVKDERLQRLLTLMRELTKAGMVRQLGRTVEVLVEKPGRNDGDMEGRTADFRIVHFRGNARLTGQVMPVRIIEAYGQSLRGELILAGE